MVYTAKGFCEKNKNDLSVDITALLEEKTSWAELKALAKKEATKMRGVKADGKAGGKAKQQPKRKTVCEGFSQSLRSLVDKLQQTEHLYIRCLKPNQTLQPDVFDMNFMTKQIAYSGVLECTQVIAPDCS